jgi:hypothetical protein
LRKRLITRLAPKIALFEPYSQSLLSDFSSFSKSSLRQRLDTRSSRGNGVVLFDMKDEHLFMMRFTGLLDVETRLLYVAETFVGSNCTHRSTAVRRRSDMSARRHLVGQLLLNS